MRNIARYRRHGLWRDRQAVAAIEMALMAPFFAMLLFAIANFSFAFYSKLQLTAAVSNGAQYAFTSGQNLTAATIPAYLANIGTVVQNSSGITVNSPTVLFNNAGDGSNFNSCYCISNSGSWTVATCGAPCSTEGPTAGKFVSIAASYPYQPLIPNSFLKTGPLNASLIARIQ